MTWRSEVSFDPLGDEHIPLMGGFRLWLHAGACAPSHSENHLAPPVSESHKRLKNMIENHLPPVSESESEVQHSPMPDSP